jgi:predicted outer membrane repeat protein
MSVTNGLFQGNRCTASSCDGGAVFVFSQAAFSDTSFVGNTAQDQGGAVSAPGILSVTGGLFQNNRSLFGVGGGLFAPGMTDISGTLFRGNMARSDGGGLYASTVLTVTRALFQDNQSTMGHGGGLAANGRLTMRDTQFLRNSAQQGGGLQHELGDGQIFNGLFAGNVATTTAGMAILLDSAGRVDLVHLTVAHPASASGPAIEVLTGTVGLTNSIVVSHSIGISNSGGIVSQNYNLFFANGSNSQGPISGGLNTVTGDPAFIDPGSDDYHLGPGSAAIDNGTDAGVITDFDSEPRPQGLGFDIGYDEVPPPTTGIKLYLPFVTR